MQQEAYRDALKNNIEYVLRRYPKNKKAMYQKCKCYLYLDLYEEFEAYYGELIKEYQSQNKEIRDLYSTYKMKK